MKCERAAKRRPFFLIRDRGIHPFEIGVYFCPTYFAGFLVSVHFYRFSKFVQAQQGKAINIEYSFFEQRECDKHNSHYHKLNIRIYDQIPTPCVYRALSSYPKCPNNFPKSVWRNVF